jgi:hypothetical protein
MLYCSMDYYNDSGHPLLTSPSLLTITHKSE